MFKRINIRVGVFVTYEDVFEKSGPDDRSKVLDGYSKKQILGMLSMINLYPIQDRFRHSYSVNEQLEILQKLCHPDEKTFQKILHTLKNHGEKYGGGFGIPIILNRTATIMAIDEVLLNPDIPNESEKTLKPKQLVEYYLSINSFLKSHQDKYENIAQNILDYYPVMAPMNEYTSPFVPFLELFRGIHLADYMEKDIDFGTEFIKYFSNRAEHPKVYMPLLFSHILPMVKKDPDKPPIFKPRNQLELNLITSTVNDLNTVGKELEMLGIRLNVFYQYDEEYWLLLDIPFLTDNMFYLIINSFWFNHLKPLGFNHKTYFSKIGKFYEEYISGILKSSFSFLKHPQPKTLDDLKIKTGGREIEIADVYVRHNKKILIGEIKSTQFGAQFKYASNLLRSFSENEKRFCKDFGIVQVVKSILHFINIPNHFDDKIKVRSNYKIFPIIILNERMFQGPLSNLFFQKLFLEELTRQGLIDVIPSDEVKHIKLDNFILYPITIIHTIEIELLEESLKEKKISMFDLIIKHQTKGHLQSALFDTMLESVSTDFAEYGMHKIRPIIEEFDKERRETRLEEE